MTINTENPSKMVLQDKKYVAFLTAGGTVVAGLLIGCLLARHGVVPIIVGLACMGAGVFMIFKIRGVTIELDRSAGTIHILYQGLKSREERDLQMAQMQKVLLRKLIQTHRMTTTNRSGSSSSSTTYHQFILVFVTDQNEQIPFDFGKIKVGLMNMLTTPEEKIRRGAQQIADFLNVPLDAATPSATDVLGAIRDGIAGRFQKAH
jgi:hypothetical protein